MNQILTDEEIAECLMPNIGEPYAIAGRRNVRVFARAVESAVLAKVGPLLRRTLTQLSEGYDQYSAWFGLEIDAGDEEAAVTASGYEVLIRDIREVLGENE